VFTVKPRLRKINDLRITVNLIVDKADSEDRRDYLIREISKEKGIFPLSRFDMGNLPVKVIQEFEKFPTKWKISNTGGDSETLYEHKAGFYIYTKKGQQLSEVSLFYETTQHNEVQFFINRLMKLLE
jgi:hypothetical protein